MPVEISNSDAATNGVHVEGLTEFRRALRSLGPEWSKELRKVHKKLADREALKTRAAAAGFGRLQRKAADAIRPRANQRSATLAILASKSRPFANIAFWGAKRRTGWYAAGQYANSEARQHPPWVGNTWDVAEFGQGPYAINAQLARDLPEILDDYADMVDDVARRAFPERG
jgi:hypothetical protein